MGGPFRPPLSENPDFSGTEPPLDLRPVFKLEFVRCGPVEKKTERSICLGLIVALQQSLRMHFFQIIILCRKIVISPQPNIWLSLAQSVNSSLSVVVQWKKNLEDFICLCLIVAVRQSLRTDFSIK